MDAEGLAAKCFFHSASFIYLLRSTKIPELGINFFDSSSINVLARAALESFLVFHYVFVDPSDEEEKEFRYLSWKLADMLMRQKYDYMSPQGKLKQSQEKVLVENFTNQISGNKFFEKLTPKQQKALLNRGEWRLKGWTDIGISAGLSEDHAKSCYRFLCSYAHAGSMSVLQTRQAMTAEQQKALCGATMALTMITMAFFVKSYCRLFEKCKTYLSKEEDINSFIKMWVEIGATPLKEVDVNWDKLSF